MTVATIIDEIERQFGIPFIEIQSKSDEPIIQEARRTLCYELWRRLKLSQASIGKILKRQHTTVHYMLKTARKNRFEREARARNLQIQQQP